MVRARKLCRHPCMKRSEDASSKYSKTNAWAREMSLISAMPEMSEAASLRMAVFLPVRALYSMFR